MTLLCIVPRERAGLATALGRAPVTLDVVIDRRTWSRRLSRRRQRPEMRNMDRRRLRSHDRRQGPERRGLVRGLAAVLVVGDAT
jgi:hypothetical protein